MKRMRRNNRRSLKVIEAGLAKSLAANDKSMIESGEWLVEAKEHLVEHGEWLPWLEVHFPHSVPTAERWMRVAVLCAKFVKLTNLKINKGALYHLADKIDDLDDRIISDIVKAAAKNPGKWIKEYDIFGILAARKLKQEAAQRGISVGDLKREREQQSQERVDAVRREREEWQRQAEANAEVVAEADALLDGMLDAPCDAPPLPVEAPVGVRPSQGAFVHDTLTNAVAQIDTIISKPMRALTAAPISSDALERAGRFLLDIVNARNANQEAA
jgi:Protein of unknown function (DUF3102)